MIPAALLLMLLGGCEIVLGLDQVHTQAGSGACDPNSHDEDADGIPDCMDVCPGIKDDQTDSDGDGVGDACDPQPGKPDTLLTFYAFDRADELAQFTPFGGHWTVQDDALINDESTSDQEDHLLEGATRGAPIAIEAGVTVDSIQPTPPSGLAYAVAIEYRTSELDEYSCAIRRKLDVNDNVLDQVEAYTPTSSTSQPLANSKLGPGAAYQMREVLDGTGMRCEVMGAAQDGGTVSASPPLPTGPESVGFYTEDTAVHYHYLAIYALGS